MRTQQQVSEARMAVRRYDAGARPVAVVTGASAGVGRATARAYGERGWSVGLLARGRDGLEAAKREVEAMGGRALAIPTDVADGAAVDAAAERVEAELGPIEVWVNDAMVTAYAPFERMTPEEFRRITEVTYLGYVHGTRAALRRMRRRERGTIVQVGSALAYRAIPLQSAYCGAKFAIRGFTEALRAELMHEGSGVRLTMVQMPALNTPQFDININHMPHRPQPVPPIYQPEVAAEAILQAADEAPRELWVGRSTVQTVLGNIAAPGLLDRLFARSGYSMQQTDEPDRADRPNNLWEPVPGDHGAHGRFDDRAGDSGAVVDPSFLREAVAGLAATLAVGAAVALGSRLLAGPSRR
jgi:NAD(P)-dependent dehydrogenase (short-subunit alcohol dehydrogenase family)